MRMLIVFRCVLFISALTCLFRSFEKMRDIKKCYGYKVDATIIDNHAQTIGAGIFVYYPIYSYVMDGETCTYKGKYPSAYTMNIGTVVPLYYDYKTRNPVEATSVVGELIFAMVFSVVAMILMKI